MENGKNVTGFVGRILSTIGIVGIIFSILILLIAPFLWLFSIIAGGVFIALLIAGVICLVVDSSKRKKKEMLLRNNQYVMAEVIDIDIDLLKKFHVDQLTLNPYVITCQYIAPNKQVYTFKSKPLLYNPSGLLRENQLKVYVDLNHPKRYMVDTNSILPEKAMLHKFKIGWRAEELKSDGQYLMATTCGVELLGIIKIKGMTIKPVLLKLSDSLSKQFDIPVDHKNRVYLGHTVLCRYNAPNGEIHIFASKGIWGEPERAYLGEEVKVYYKEDNYKHYYVDVESVVPLSGSI